MLYTHLKTITLLFLASCLLHTATSSPLRSAPPNGAVIITTAANLTAIPPSTTSRVGVPPNPFEVRYSHTQIRVSYGNPQRLTTYTVATNFLLYLSNVLGHEMQTRHKTSHDTLPGWIVQTPDGMGFTLLGNPARQYITYGEVSVALYALTIWTQCFRFQEPVVEAILEIFTPWGSGLADFGQFGFRGLPQSIGAGEGNGTVRESGQGTVDAEEVKNSK